MIPGTTTYLQRLATLFESIQATDATGSPLPLDEATFRAMTWLTALASRGGKVLIIGNGGSAAIASHVQVDLANALGVRALSFDMLPQLTANGNDHGYESVYERPVETWADRDDVLIAISSSGRSMNILRAVNAAKNHGCRVLTLSGFKPDNPLRSRGDVNLYVPSESYGPVELTHQCLLHHLADAAVAARASRNSP